MGGVFCKLGPSEPEDEQPAQKTYSWYVRMHVYVCVCMCMCVCVCVSLSFSPPSLCLNALFLFANLRDTRETKDPSQFQFKDLKGFVPHRFKQRLGTHTHSLLHSLSHVLTHSLTYSLTHSLTHVHRRRETKGKQSGDIGDEQFQIDNCEVCFALGLHLPRMRRYRSALTQSPRTAFGVVPCACRTVTSFCSIQALL